MVTEKKPSFTLGSVDDLFTTQEMRDDEKLKKIKHIPLTEIDDFPEHPFKVRDDDDMKNLVESIKSRGVMASAIVRKKEDGRYELISGHRRKRACEMLGLETLPCDVVDLTKDEATILMVESNFQRSEIKPSEKAFSYKMRLEAMKRQAGRPNKDNCGPMVHNKSRDLFGDEVGESGRQVSRYIRLTNLVDELLDLVDEGRMKMRPAVEISYLDEEAQRDLVDAIDENDCTPSHAQAIKIRKFYEEGKLNYDVVQSIMEEEKPNQKEKYTLKREKVDKLIPKEVPPTKREDYILEALDYYGRYRKRQAREQER